MTMTLIQYLKLLPPVSERISIIIIIIISDHGWSWSITQTQVKLCLIISFSPLRCTHFKIIPYSLSLRHFPFHFNFNPNTSMVPVTHYLWPTFLFSLITHHMLFQFTKITVFYYYQNGITHKKKIETLIATLPHTTALYSKKFPFLIVLYFFCTLHFSS